MKSRSIKKYLVILLFAFIISVVSISGYDMEEIFIRTVVLFFLIAAAFEAGEHYKDREIAEELRKKWDDK